MDNCTRCRHPISERGGLWIRSGIQRPMCRMCGEYLEAVSALPMSVTQMAKEAEVVARWKEHVGR